MPRNKYPEKTVEKILEASCKLFLEKGYEQTTVLDIADQMGGLTRGAFYHHFKSKEEVVAALLGKLHQDSKSFDAAADTEGLTGLEKIRAVLLANLTGRGQSKENMELYKAEVSLLQNPHILASHLQGNLNMAKRLVPLIEAGMEDGSIRRGNPAMLAELFMLLYDLWCTSAAYPSSQDEYADKVGLMKQLLDSVGFSIVNRELMEALIRLNQSIQKN